MSNLNKMNAQQKNLMADFMASHQDLAKNLLPNCHQGKATSIRLWQQLSENLNSIGPPIKDVKGWRKTFTDQKYQIKNKLSFNKHSKMKTGGGKFEEKVLTATEELILSATGLDVAVEGIAVRNFGVLAEDITFPTAPGPSNTQLPSTASSSPSTEPFFEFSEVEPPVNPIENQPTKYSKKVDVKLSLLKDKIKMESSHNEAIANKLDRLLEVEERKIEIKERLLQIKEEKHKAYMELNAIELQIKTAHLKRLKQDY